MNATDLLTAIAIIVLIGITLAVPAGLVVLAARHLRGRRTRFDGLFEGIGRANAVNSHLQAGTPHPDDLAVPVPHRTPRRRRRAGR